MPRLKNYRQSQASKATYERRRLARLAAKSLETFKPLRGTGSRSAAKLWTRSPVTGRRQKMVIPAESPDEKLVLVVGDSHLRSVADGFVKMPEGELSFGVISTVKATASEFWAEMVNAVVPRRPKLVCLLAPIINLPFKATQRHKVYEEATKAFVKILKTVCSRWHRVFVLDFPPRICSQLEPQELLRQKYTHVAASMGVNYCSVAEHFDVTRTELWACDGVHLSDDLGMEIFVRLLWKHASMEMESVSLEPDVPASTSPPVGCLSPMESENEEDDSPPPPDPPEVADVRRYIKRIKLEQDEQSCAASETAVLNQQLESVRTEPDVPPSTSPIESENEEDDSPPPPPSDPREVAHVRCYIKLQRIKLEEVEQYRAASEMTVFNQKRIKLSEEERSSAASEMAVFNQQVYVRHSHQRAPKKGKIDRKIEFRWMNFVGGEFKPVRTKKGGGTRKDSVLKDSTKHDLIEQAARLFFPDGRNALGDLADFDVDMADFQMQHLEDSVTVGELYDKTKLPLLRFYLVTRRSNSTDSFSRRK